MRTLAAALVLAPALALAAAGPDTGPDAGTPWPEGSLGRDQILLGVVLVHLEPDGPDRAPEVLAGLARRHLPELPAGELDADPEKPLSGVRWRPGEEESFTERQLELFARHVDPAVQRSLLEKHPATFVVVRGPAAEATTLQGFTRMIGAAAKKLGAVVYDLETRDLYDARSWEERRGKGFTKGVPVVKEHVVVHSYEHEGAIRSVTLGMSKLGLPDLVVNGHGRRDVDDVTALLTAVGQWLLENGELEESGWIRLDLHDLLPSPARDELLGRARLGAEGKVDLEVAVAEVEEGDAQNELMELVLGGPDASTEEKTAVLTRLFGPRDPIVRVRSNDAALAAASARAVKAVPRFKRAFVARKPGEQFQVKVPFDVPDGRSEYMWVEIRSWRGTRIEGTLANEPAWIDDLELGDEVTVDEAKIYDWSWTHADGRTEGNATGEVLRGRTPEDDER